jgi:peptide/nickel transport system ATP-binding protein/oligopeptide transport system ATP-binding protein
MSAVPIPHPSIECARERIILQGDAPCPANPPSCRPFHSRDPMAERGRYDVEAQTFARSCHGQWVACHLATP